MTAGSSSSPEVPTGRTSTRTGRAGSRSPGSRATRSPRARSTASTRRPARSRNEPRHEAIAIVIEEAESNYAAYVPSLPGCIATGPTVEEAERRLREAIELHVEGMCEDGQPIPDPSSRVEYLDVDA